MRNCRSSPTANYIVGEGFGLCILLMRLSNEYFFDTLKTEAKASVFSIVYARNRATRIGRTLPEIFCKLS